MVDHAREDTGEEPLMVVPDDVTVEEARRRVQRAIRQLKMVDQDLAIIEAREKAEESVAAVARRVGLAQAQLEVIRPPEGRQKGKT